MSRSESKSLFCDYHEMADIWARIQAFDQLFMIRTVETCKLRKRLTLSAASIFVAEGLFICIYSLLFKENLQNRISRAGDKILQRFRSFFVK